MARCPFCNSKIEDSEKNCRYCGKEVIPASFLESIPTKTSTGQKIFIIVSFIILIAIIFTFMGVQKREDQASQRIFSEPVSQIIASAAVRSGLGHIFGMPGHTLKADPKTAQISIVFPKGQLSEAQARNYASYISGMVARTYVDKGYMPREVTVTIASDNNKGQYYTYGRAVYNGDKDFITWEPETW